METDTDAGQHRKDTEKALNLAYWSLLGLIIPLVGWILAGISLQTLSDIPSEWRNKPKAKSAKRIAVLSLLMASAVAAYWGYVSYTNFKQQEERTSQEAAQAEKAKNDAATRATLDAAYSDYQAQAKQKRVDDCIAEVDDRFSKITVYSAAELNQLAQAKSVQTADCQSR